MSKVKLSDVRPDLYAAIELPKGLAAIVDRLETLKAVRSEIYIPTKITPEADFIVRQGMTPDEATAAHRAEVAAKQTAESQGTAIGQAVDALNRDHRRYIENHGSELIAGPIRTAVAEVLEEAVPLADQLDPGAMTPRRSEHFLRTASTKDLKVYRESRDLQDRWDTLRRGYGELFRTVVSSPGTDAHRLLNPIGKPRPGRDTAGGVFGWTGYEDTFPTSKHPVPDELRHGHVSEILAVARYAEYVRLATPEEVAQIAHKWRRVGGLAQVQRATGRGPLPGVTEPKYAIPGATLRIPYAGKPASEIQRTAKVG